MNNSINSFRTSHDMTTQAIPWVEKYRPKVLEDVVGNKDVIETLKSFRSSKQFPHLLLCGQPGIGKTTSIHCLARELLKDKYKEAVLELNASDERGIDTIRTTIKAFCEKKVMLPDNIPKVVILDEADSMTTAAFQALRRTMEIHSKTTRFVLACNTPEKVIEPIQSRCSRLNFRPLSTDEVINRITKIARLESMNIADDAIKAIEIISEGDLRKAVNALQTCAVLKGTITAENVYQRNDLPSADVILKALSNCLKKNFDEAVDEVSKISVLGFDGNDVIDMLVKMISKVDTSEEIRVKLYEAAAPFLIRRVNSYVQVYGMLAQFCLVN
ncbi:replication factor C subunit, putative [Entamoeba invadens IP1]|uniref:Replication factor C subunit, putative n=1 Tax=Entamoeba invadens IP1 TaxID=370355 RepID=A0A0A1TYB0_ENTIV|nr:replication factor C subunit, putative [Entamoeba invadens IP1]ELP84530.1 replication factor C subunit, putative [Entamoeba invadens IP1]|eukprot:XP_004183876.1 replication factor C subunit, putative [Entamoeba invadens IP1]